MTQVARLPLNIRYLMAHRHLRKARKIVFALKRRPSSPNIGDHAQTIAIREWINRHYPCVPLLELTREETGYFLPALRRLLGPSDLILLQSGGNMGDFGKRAEHIRLAVIEAFPDNRIVSLPQTIRVDDAVQTQAQRERMRRVYGGHHRLRVFARDPVSERLIRAALPECETTLVPDFVLSMPLENDPIRRAPPRVLLCLRNDKSSKLSAQDRQSIGTRLPYSSMFFDTHGDRPLAADQHRQVLHRVIETFRQFDAVVTDRFHGLIFSILCRKPCVILESAGHKMASAHEFFGICRS